MSAHNFYKDWLSGTRRMTSVHFKINTGATGAVSSFSSKKEGITSVSRASAGRYLCTLDQKYGELIDVSAGIFVTTASGAYNSAKATNGYFVRTAVVGVLDTGNAFNLQFIDNANADADVQDNTVIKVIATMRDS
jgi:hypothetical protein